MWRNKRKLTCVLVIFFQGQGWERGNTLELGPVYMVSSKPSGLLIRLRPINYIKASIIL